jgi:hypothetical protein
MEIKERRVEELFCRKKMTYQVAVREKALLNDLEIDIPNSAAPSRLLQQHSSTSMQGSSVPSDFVFAGPKLNANAPLMKRNGFVRATQGLGIYLHWLDQGLI